MRFRRRRAREQFIVQLHVASLDGVVSSFAPMDPVDSLSGARSQAHRLRNCNKWGAADRWPLVTIHDQDGRWYPEVRESLVVGTDGVARRWEGR